MPKRANGDHAIASYLRAPTGGIRQGTGLDVFTLTGDRIGGITHFQTSACSHRSGCHDRSPADDSLAGHLY